MFAIQNLNTACPECTGTLAFHCVTYLGTTGAGLESASCSKYCYGRLTLAVVSAHQSRSLVNRNVEGIMESKGVHPPNQSLWCLTSL